MAKTKTKAAALPVPQSHDEVANAIFKIGEYDRQIGLLDIGCKDALAKVKQTFEEQSQPVERLREMLIASVVTYCEAHRLELTNQGKTKTASFTSGKVSWRARPPKCSLPKDQSILLNWLKEFGHKKFIRVTEEVSREALLAVPKVASSFPGVKIGSAGEDIIVEPFSPEGLEAAS
jgi:phage host-nuclease inhibitor protein Gam